MPKHGRKLATAAVWTAGRLAAVGARVGYAVVEGTVYAFSKPSAGVILAAELAAFCICSGARLPLRVATSTLLAVGTLRTGQCLFMSFRRAGLKIHTLKELESIWDWEPPTDDTNQSSAWHTLRQIIMTANKLRADNPGIQHLLDQPILAANELAMRLFYFFSTSDERPILGSTLQLAAGAELAGAAELAAGSGDGPAAMGGDSGVEEVPAELVKQLACYRDITCLAYHYNKDKDLSDQLHKRGYQLLCASHCADLTSGCPAYYMCISEEKQEVVLAIRGTFSPEDAFFDLMATGEPFDAPDSYCAAVGSAAADKHLTGACHSGIGKGALFLGRKFGPLLRPLYAEGYKISLVGHSLGAGVASLLAVYLRNRGLGGERMRCWGFETPACMDLDLAQACSDMITTTVHVDDVVPRLSVRGYASLLEELAVFDWQAVAARSAAGRPEGDGGGPAVAQHLSKLLLWAFDKSSDDSSGGDSSSSADSADGGEDGDGGSSGGGGGKGLVSTGSEHFDRDYNAHVPGRVVLLYRKSAPAAAAGGGGSSGYDGDGNSDVSSDSGVDGASVSGDVSSDSGGGKASSDGKPSEGGSENGSAGSSGDGSASGTSSASSGGGDGDAVASYGMVLVDCTHPAVTTIRVSSRMMSDHFVDTPDVIAALGG